MSQLSLPLPRRPSDAVQQMKALATASVAPGGSPTARGRQLNARGGGTPSSKVSG
jgi:hypothetical protein